MTGRKPSMNHGDYGYARKTRCPCQPCRRAEAAYSKRLKFDHDRGIYRLIDATPLVDHIENLLVGGASIYQIDQAAGISRTNLKRILYGESKTVQRPTAERLLAVTLQDCLTATQRRVDVIGTLRRFDALEYLGHSKAVMAKEIGVSTAMVYDYSYSRFLFSDTVEQIHRAYVTLRETEGDNVRIRWAAYRRDAKPWMCWDDETIDDIQMPPHDAACIVGHCTRPTHRESLCSSHYYTVKSQGGLANTKRFRLLVNRISAGRPKDGKRTEAQVEDLMGLGMTKGEITSHLGLDEDYVERVQRKVAS